MHSRTHVLNHVHTQICIHVYILLLKHIHIHIHMRVLPREYGTLCLPNLNYSIQNLNYIYYLFSFCLVLWHSNPCWLFNAKSCLYIYHHHHHHHDALPARISQTLSRRFSLSFIATGLHPVSSHSCCMYVRAGRPAFAGLYEGIHRSTSLMSSSLLLQHCPACLVRIHIY